MEMERPCTGIDRNKNVYECKTGTYTDLVLAETRDHAKEKFKRLTTIQGKTITTDIEVKFLYVKPS
jgi:hypothetical protein